MNQTVFVADDDDAMRDALVQLLETAGLQVAAHADGPAFRRPMRQTAPAACCWQCPFIPSLPIAGLARDHALRRTTAHRQQAGASRRYGRASSEWGTSMPRTSSPGLMKMWSMRMRGRRLEKVAWGRPCFASA